MAAIVQIKRLTPDPDNTDMRVYFSRAELTKKNHSAERGGPRPKDPVLSAALEIPGVVVACVKPYSLMIVKAPPFEWAEIEPSLLRLLTTFNMGEGCLEAS